MESLKEFFNDVNFECEDDELFIDRQLEDRGFIAIRLVTNKNKPMIFDTQQIMLVLMRSGGWALPLDNLKDALNLPFGGVPRFLVESALNETLFVDDLNKK